MPGEKLTLAAFQQYKQAGRKFSVLTCYDAPTARLMEQAGVEMLLVGDTAAEVVLGLPSTRKMPPEFLLTLTAAVRRGAPNTFLLADLPYLCRCDDDATTTRWSRRFLEDTGADALKIEVTPEQPPLVQRLSDAKVPVVAHIGLLPQMIDPETGYRARGRDAQDAFALIASARRFESVGAVAILLEAVASEVAGEIAAQVSVPVIGCVAGPHCDGTVVVLHDMIGLAGGHKPRKVRQYEDLSGILMRAFAAYVDDIHAGRFPADEHAIHMKPGELQQFLAMTSRP